ncbi:hypothetical protein [Pseudomaricurvus sp.]|uniref:hypothetical protein n=1 Tax=Pseudomaricurvus sp. TaxID=2004510 RepID=UPI003F6CD752
MIVFTATNLQTQDVYVGTARESVEEEWADLLSQADSGTSGEFFQQLRDYGSAAFEVDTWAYGENSAEARQSMREAKEELGALPIKSSRGKSAGRSTKAVQSASMKALMAVFEEAMSEDSVVDEDDALEGLTPTDRVKQKDPTAIVSEEASAGPADDVNVSEKGRAPTDIEPVSASEVNHDAPLVDQQKGDDEQKMLSRLEAMKAAQERLLKERASSTKAAPPKSKAEKAAASEKLARGRTGSAAKEKRIREAIETERERRENLRLTSSRDEQAEMNAVMARVEMRRMATKKANAEKSKLAAAARRAKQKAEAKSESSARAESLTAANSSAEGNSVESSSVKKASKAAAPPSKTATAAGKAKTATSSAAGSKKTSQERGALKLAAGRTGSSAKEKRIKEAIEQEKAERLAAQQAKRAAEAEEMANILARLEARAKEAEKVKRRR